MTAGNPTADVDGVLRSSVESLRELVRIADAALQLKATLPDRGDSEGAEVLRQRQRVEGARALLAAIDGGQPLAPTLLSATGETRLDVAALDVVADHRRIMPALGPAVAKLRQQFGED